MSNIVIWHLYMLQIGHHNASEVTQSCLTLCGPMDYTVHGILQARMLERVDFPFSRGSSQSWEHRTQVSHTAGKFFTSWATQDAKEHWGGYPIPFPVDLPDLGIKQGSPALQADSLPTELSGKPIMWVVTISLPKLLQFYWLCYSLCCTFIPMTSILQLEACTSWSSLPIFAPNCLLGKGASGDDHLVSMSICTYESISVSYVF